MCTLSAADSGTEGAGEGQDKICILESSPGTATVARMGSQQVREKGEAGVCALVEADNLASSLAQRGHSGKEGQRQKDARAVFRSFGWNTPLCRERCCQFGGFFQLL